MGLLRDLFYEGKGSLTQLKGLQLSNLVDPRLMASSVKWRLQPEFHDLDSKFCSNDPCTNSQHVCIIM